MGKSRYRVLDADSPHFVTSAIVKWLPLFAEPELVRIVLNSIRHLQTASGLRLHGYVVMENHLHLIVSGDDWSKALARFKNFTAKRMVTWLLENGRAEVLRELSFALRQRGDAREHQVWQEGLHPQKISGEQMLRQKLEYMHANPIRRGYVDEATAWRNSSARNYAGMDGVLEVEMLT